MKLVLCDCVLGNFLSATNKQFFGFWTGFSTHPLHRTSPKVCGNEQSSRHLVGQQSKFKGGGRGEGVVFVRGGSKVGKIL